MVSEVFNMHCVEYMRTLPDNHFDIAICDPPYGDADSVKNNLGGGAVWGTVRPLQEATNYPPQSQQQVNWNPHTRRNVGDKVQKTVNHAYGSRFSRYSGGANRKQVTTH